MQWLIVQSAYLFDIWLIPKRNHKAVLTVVHTFFRDMPLRKVESFVLFQIKASHRHIRERHGVVFILKRLRDSCARRWKS